MPQHAHRTRRIADWRVKLMEYVIVAALVFAAGVIVGVLFHANLSDVYGTLVKDVAAMKADALAFSVRLKALEDGVKKAL